ncbi:MAG: hypothetical protein OEL83_14165 [Desulforhopalus sp.]|nr:hypothetical protein [Desulforhopalus sp.]
MRWRLPGGQLALLLFLFVASATAGQAEDLTGLLPADGEVAGLTQSDTPQVFHGEDLYQMIDGGADIYHEYGFRQVLSAEYAGDPDKIIKLELYEMASPLAAYGLYSFKVGEGGKELAIGREGRLEDYYLNFWKGNMQVTLIGQDAGEETVQGVVALAEAIAAKITATGARPELADLLLREPLAFSRAKYLRGPIGLMNSYVFDREDIFRVRDGFAGRVEACLAMVFRYPGAPESAGAYEYATSKLLAGTRFSKQSQQENHFTMVDRKAEHIMITQTGRHIAIVIGKDVRKVQSISAGLVAKLKL